MVVVPGSGQNKSAYTEILPVFIPYGYDVVLMDYEGFGNSPGNVDLNNLIDDAKAVFLYAVFHNSNVFGFGASIGTPVLARIAADLDLSGCIFEGTLLLEEEPGLWLDYHNINVPFVEFLGEAIIGETRLPDYDIEHWITKVNEPKFFIHSIYDDVTPHDGVMAVYDAAPLPKMLWSVGGYHVKTIRVDPQLYKDVVLSWMEIVLKEE